MSLVDSKCLQTSIHSGTRTLNESENHCQLEDLPGVPSIALGAVERPPWLIIFLRGGRSRSALPNLVQWYVRSTLSSQEWLSHSNIDTNKCTTGNSYSNMLTSDNVQEQSFDSYTICSTS